MRERWGEENGMAAGEVRLMAEGKKVLGNMRGGMGKKSRKRKEKNLRGNRMGREFHLGHKKFLGSDGSSPAEEQFDAIKKDELMEHFKKDLVGFEWCRGCAIQDGNQAGARTSDEIGGECGRCF